MAAEATVDAIITQALSIADAQSQDVAQYTSEAQSAAVSVVTLDTATLTFSDYPEEYPVPNDMDSGADIALFNSLITQLSNLAATTIANFITTYFPNTCMYSEAEDWICEAIRDGGTGMNAAVEDAIWQRDRDRLLKDATRLEQEVVDRWGARGFALPAGFTAYEVDKVTADYYNKVSEASRDVAIKQAEIEIQNIRFAVEQGLKYRLSAIDAAVNYIKAILLGPMDASVKLSLDHSQTKAALISASASYYNARTNAKQLALTKAIKDYEGVLQANRDFVELVTKNTSSRVAAAVGAAEAAGKTAAAALSSINAVAQLGNITNA